MAKKKKFEKIKEIVTYDDSGNITTQKLTGKTGGYKATDLYKTTKKEPTVLDNLGLWGKSLKTGGIKGTVGMVDAPLQEAQNSLEQGKKVKDTKDIVKHSAKGLIYTVSPTVGQIVDNLDNLYTSLTSKKQKKEKPRKFSEKVLDSFSETLDNATNAKAVKEQLVALGAVDKNVSKKVKNLRKVVNKPVEKSEKDLQKELNSKNYSDLSKTMSTVSGTLGNMGPSIAATLITKNPTAGLAAMGIGVKGQSTKEAEDRGVDLDKAIKIGNAKTGVEVGTEMLTGGLNFFGKGALDDIAEKGVNKLIKNKAGNFIAKKGLGMVGEAFEEDVANLADAAIDRATGDKNAKYTRKDALDSAKNTALTTLVLNGIGGGYGRRAYNQNAYEVENFDSKEKAVKETQNKVKKGVITPEEGIKAIKDIQSGVYELKQNLADIAGAKVQELQQAVQQGMITPEEGTAEMETIKQVAQQQFNEINNPSITKQSNTFNISENNSFKKQQNEIIQKINPMNNDYNVGIRNENDIKTWDEVLNSDDETEGQFAWGDYTRKDALKAQQDGKVTVYSSKPIENGNFVSTSKIQATEYAGGDESKVYSKEVPLTDVAWINGDEGQYARVDTNSKLSYNNTNEEGVKNETKIDSRTTGRITSNNSERTLGENGQNVQRTREYTKQEYRKYEQSAAKNRTRNITQQQQQLQSTIKNKFNKNINFYDGNEIYNGGASTDNPSLIHISSIKSSNTQNFIAHHEVIESEIMHNKKLSDNYLKPAINEILNDPNFEEAKKNFKAGDSILDNVSDYLIAKELLCDYFAEKETGINKQYSLPLAKETIANLDYTMERINESFDNQRTSDSSFSDNKNNVLYENKQSNEQILRFNDDGTSELVDNKPQILDKMPKQKKGIKNTLEELVDAKNKVRQKFTDHRQVVYDLSRKLKNPTLYHKADAIDSASSLAQYQIGKKQTNLQGKPFKNFANENGEKVSMGFEKAYDMYKDIPVKSKNEYLVHQLNLDRLNQGTEQFKGFDADESLDTIQALEKKYPDINKWANNIWQYNKNQLQNMVDAGLVSQKLADEFMKTTPHYVRIQRDVGNIKNGALKIKNGKIEVNNQIQKVKGSELDTLPIKEVTAQYTEDVMRAIKTNQFGQELAKSMSVSSQDNSISAVDESFGINPDLIGQDADGNYTFTIFNNGSATVIPINEDIAKALKPRDIRTSKWNPAMHIANAQRTLLTDKNPYFMATNAVKDAGDMFLYSKYSIPRNIATYTELFGGRTIGKLNRNSNKVRTSDWVNLWKSLGGESSSYFNQGEFTSQKGKISKVVDKALSPIEKGNEFIESMPRITEFVNTIRANGYTLNTEGEIVPKKGKNPTKSVDQVLNEAMYNSAEITTNFKRGGTWAKNIDKNGGVFFNASVQGASKLGRTFTEAFGDAKNGDFKAAKRLVGRVLVLGVAPAIINNAMHGDDDEYKNLPDYIKDQYYLIKGKDGKWIRIPKGRAVSLLESASRRTIEKSKGGKFGLADYTTLIGNQIAPNDPFNNNSIAPLIQAKNNKSWNGSDIVPSYLENKSHPEEEYDAKTSSISKWLGEQLHLSPKKIDYVIDQYSGVIGDIALPSTTNYAENENSNGFDALVNPFKSKFTVDSTLNNKTVGKYYNELEKAEGNKKSINATEEDKLKYKLLNSYSKDISELQKQQREIQNADYLSDSEKYSQNKELQKQIIKMQKEAIKKSKDVSVYDDYARVGDKIYYKNSKDEWQKESDTERKRREWSDYGIADYYYYKKQQQEETKQKRAEKASQDSSFASSIGITDDEFEEYKYKASKVEGTKGANGKTVRGSVKSARIRYINSLPLSADQKQALYNYLYKRK